MLQPVEFAHTRSVKQLILMQICDGRTCNVCRTLLKAFQPHSTQLTRIVISSRTGHRRVRAGISWRVSPFTGRFHSGVAVISMFFEMFCGVWCAPGPWRTAVCRSTALAAPWHAWQHLPRSRRQSRRDPLFAVHVATRPGCHVSASPIFCARLELPEFEVTACL